MNLRKLLKTGIILFFISFLIFFVSPIKLFAEEIDFIEVANSSDEIQLIDPNSIKYNNKGFLSVVAKYIKLNPDNKEIINSNSYLLAIDCDNRLYSELPMNSELKQVKTWLNPIDNKLIKKTIINSCSF